MNTNFVRGRYYDKNTSHEVETPIFIFEDSGSWIYYSPALDLSGYGATKNEAEESFTVAFGEFMKYSVNKDTLKSVLFDLGWSYTSLKKKYKRLEAPALNVLLERDPYLLRVFNSKEFEKINKKVEIPA